MTLAQLRLQLVKYRHLYLAALARLREAERQGEDTRRDERVVDLASDACEQTLRHLSKLKQRGGGSV